LADLKSPSELSVLAVSDDPQVRDEARFGFPAGVNVSLAVESRDAWDHMKDDEPDVVVVDIQTGSAGGFNLAQDMAASERLRDVPVLVLIERPQDAWLARKAGARAVLTKPIEVSELVREVLAVAAPESATSAARDLSSS
jgi:CheY-like chemotaxis protein